MEVRLILVCSLIVLPLSSVMCAVSDLHEHVNNIDDISVDGLAPSSTNVKNVINFPVPVGQILKPSMDDNSQIKDTYFNSQSYQNNKLTQDVSDSHGHSDYIDDDSSPASDTNVYVYPWQMGQIPKPNYQIERTQNQLTEAKIDSLMQSNNQIVGMLRTLYTKFDSIFETTDLMKKRPSAKKNFDYMERLEILRKLNDVHQFVINACKMDHQTTQPNSLDQIRVIKKLIGDMDRENKRCRSNVLNKILANSIETMYGLKSVYGLLENIYQRTSETESNGKTYEDIPCDDNDNTSGYRIDCRRNMDKQRSNKERNDRMCRNVHGDTKKVIYEPEKLSCYELSTRRDGIYKFNSMDEASNKAGRFFYEQYCDFNDKGAAWTVIQRRFANDHPENFNRSSLEYKLGFGELDKEFWFGNDYIHKLTSDDDMELRIVLKDNTGRKEWVEYSTFKVGSEDDNYNLTIEGYRGSIPLNSLYKKDQDYDTYNRQNGNNDNLSCTSTDESGLWWFNNCVLADDYKGVALKNWLGRSSLKSTKFMVRPKALRHSK